MSAARSGHVRPFETNALLGAWVATMAAQVDGGDARPWLVAALVATSRPRGQAWGRWQSPRVEGTGVVCSESRRLAGATVAGL
ncbi:MAG: hypothetical protein NTV94_18225, partial [Planctomycetota bacterium]|nr:hypothetical protein [Planctomycetota bacterium]